MPPADKPRHRSGYTPEDALQVQSACLTVAVTLGAYLDDLCIVGGLVPSLLIDQRASSTRSGAGHPGTNDLDIALAIALLDDQRYAEISHRLRQEGFGPDENAKGNPAVQRWRLRDLKVTIDFLMAPLPGQDTNRRVQFSTVTSAQWSCRALSWPSMNVSTSNSTDTRSQARRSRARSPSAARPPSSS